MGIIAEVNMRLVATDGCICIDRFNLINLAHPMKFLGSVLNTGGGIPSLTCLILTRLGSEANVSFSLRAIHPLRFDLITEYELPWI